MWEYSPEGSNGIQTYIGNGSIFNHGDCAQPRCTSTISHDRAWWITSMILVQPMHCNDGVTPRFARLGGWLLLAGAVGTVVACSTPTVEGTDIDSASQGASSGKRTKRTTSTKKTTDDSAAPSSTATGTGSSSTPMTSTTAVPSSTSTTSPTPTTIATTPVPSTTATTPPPAQQPACGSNDPAACLNCCLDANPGATQFEDNYEACMSTCAQGDIACLDDCQRQHVSECAANATCAKNHACMEANNCLNTNYCNPI